MNGKPIRTGVGILCVLAGVALLVLVFAEDGRARDAVLDAYTSVRDNPHALLDDDAPAAMQRNASFDEYDLMQPGRLLDLPERPTMVEVEVAPPAPTGATPPIDGAHPYATGILRARYVEHLGLVDRRLAVPFRLWFVPRTEENPADGWYVLEPTAPNEIAADNVATWRMPVVSGALILLGLLIGFVGRRTQPAPRSDSHVGIR